MPYIIEYIADCTMLRGRSCELCTVVRENKADAWTLVQYLLKHPQVQAVVYPAEIDPAFHPLSVSKFPMFV